MSRPGAVLPLTEAEWIIGAMELVYPEIVDKVNELARKADKTAEDEIRLENLCQQEEEILKAIELIELRVRECLTGEGPAPPQRAYETIRL